MIHHFKLCSLLAMLMALAACASNDITMLKPERRAEMRSVALITAVGNTVSHTRYTFFAHLPETRTERVDWNFDKTVADRAREGLAKRQPQLAITPISHDSAKLAEPLYVTSETEPYADPSRIAEPLRAIVDGTDIDTIILITSGGDAVDKCDAGLLIATSHLALVPTGIAVCLGAFVLDAKSLTVLSQVSGVVNANYNRGGIFGPIDPAPFNSSFQLPLNEEQRAFLRPTYERMLREATDKALQRSGL